MRRPTGTLWHTLFIIQLLRLVNAWLFKIPSTYFVHAFHNLLVILIINRESGRAQAQPQRLQLVLLTLDFIYFQLQLVYFRGLVVDSFVEGAGLLDLLELHIHAPILLLPDLILQQLDFIFQSFYFF